MYYLQLCFLILPWLLLFSYYAKRSKSEMCYKFVTESRFGIFPVPGCSLRYIFEQYFTGEYGCVKNHTTLHGPVTKAKKCLHCNSFRNLGNWIKMLCWGGSAEETGYFWKSAGKGNHSYTWASQQWFMRTGANKELWTILFMNNLRWRQGVFQSPFLFPSS